MLHSRVEIEIHMILQLFIQTAQYSVVVVRAQMAHGCVEERQLVLHAQLLETRTGCGIERTGTTAVLNIDLIHIPHQFQGGITPDVFMERPAEVVRDIVFSIRESAGASEAVHDRAGSAVDAALDLVPVNRAFTFMKLFACFKYSHTERRG